ncbi:MAG: DMT family transporter [Alphaproteobacteria bacterium]|nr:DMT family transporter [Alphaproteobacteria bacterium]
MSLLPHDAPGGQVRGVTYGLMGGLCLSFGGPLVRLIEQAEGWQILTYRCGAFTVTLLLLIVAQYGWRSMEVIKHAFTPVGLAVAATIAAGFCFYLFALLHTTVANTVFVISMGPLLTAAIAWPVLGERLSLKTLLILLFALGGVAIMLTGAVSAGRLLGNLFALGAVFTFAIFVILCRLARDRDMLAATCLGGFLAACFSAYMAPTLIIPPMDYIYALLLGVVQVGLGFSFITWASRYIPAAEVTLLTLVETVMGPVWTWLVVGEVPAATTLIGGAIVLVCVVSHAVVALRQTRSKVSVID